MAVLLGVPDTADGGTEILRNIGNLVPVGTEELHSFYRPSMNDCIKNTRPMVCLSLSSLCVRLRIAVAYEKKQFVVVVSIQFQKKDDDNASNECSIQGYVTAHMNEVQTVEMWAPLSRTQIHFKASVKKRLDYGTDNCLSIAAAFCSGSLKGALIYQLQAQKMFVSYFFGNGICY